MSTRAASVAISQRAKQHLVNLLFKSDYARKGPEAHRKLDAAFYSYMDLRDAYLKRIQLIHPDKSKTTSNNDYDFEKMIDSEAESISNTSWNDDYSWKDVISKNEKYSTHDAFIELQEAWKKYHEIAKSMHKGKGESEIRGVQEDFTLFGVGCSFSDSLEETHMRSKIMDQAGKGWCAAGELSEFTVADKDMHNSIDITAEHANFSLIDDDMFEDSSNEDTSSNIAWSNNPATRKSLVEHLIPINKR